ncbi:MAG TPA: MarR family transcriptional regulator [Xanthomonadaceae bacterium]
MDTSFKTRLGFMIGDVTRLWRREFDRRAAHLGLTRVQWRALRRIERFQGMTQVELAEDLELAPIAVGRVLDRLEKSGFVERRPDPKDRRCWRLHLAPGSVRVMPGVDGIAGDLIEELFADIPQADLEATERSLLALKKRLGGICKQAPDSGES